MLNEAWRSLDGIETYVAKIKKEEATPELRMTGKACLRQTELSMSSTYDYVYIYI